MGPALGFGDEDDAALAFKSVSEKYNSADHFVLRFPSTQLASNWYQENFSNQYNSNSIAVSAPWTTPSTWSFHSSQQHAACTINNVAYEKEVCQFMGQYEEFVVIFWSVIRPNLMTHNQFERTVAAIDGIMRSHLEESAR
jgi:hypothetical protein